MVRIIAFDPAVTVMGVAVLSIEDGGCHVLHTQDVVGKKLLHDKEMIKIFADVPGFCVVEAYKVLVWQLLKAWKPDEVVAERAFVHKFPAALISLTLVLNAIRVSSWVVSQRDIRIISPTQTKMIITGHGDADKDMMKLGILGNTRITYDPSIDPQTLSEHCIDAIGHGYTQYLLRHIPEATMRVYLDSRPVVPPKVKKAKKKKVKKGK